MIKNEKYVPFDICYPRIGFRVTIDLKEQLDKVLEEHKDLFKSKSEFMKEAMIEKIQRMTKEGVE